jgi:O-succinylbenzoate synthase
MKNLITVTKNNFALNIPINVRQNLIHSINYYNLKITVKDKLYDFALSSLPFFHEIKLEEKLEFVLNYFKKLDFENITPLSPNHHPELIFTVESILLNLSFNKNGFPKNKILINTLFDAQYILPSFQNNIVKIKITNEECSNQHFIDSLNDLLNNSNILAVRFDGNQSLKYDLLCGFINKIKAKEKIQYIEEPFLSFEEMLHFSKETNIKLGFDEKLIAKQDLIPENHFAILKPTLIGVENCKTMIQKLNKKQINGIISSSYDLETDYITNLYLAHYSNDLAKESLYHGLDTIKYFPHFSKKIKLQNNEVFLLP